MMTESEKLVYKNYISHLDREIIEDATAEDLKHFALEQVNLNKGLSIYSKKNERDLINYVSWENIFHHAQKLIA